MSDEELINKVLDKNDSEALLELSERHTGIFLQTVEKYLPFSPSSTLLDDFVEDKINVVYEAAKTYNKEKGAKFVTWFGNLTRYKCLSERTKLKEEPEFYQYDVSLSGETDTTPDKYLALKDEAEMALTKIQKKFGKKARDTLYEVYFNNKTLMQIGKERGVSHERIRQENEKSLKFLRNENSIQRAYQ